MDFRTTLRELDEVIVKAQVAINNDLTDIDATPPCNGRRRKRQHLIALQALEPSPSVPRRRQAEAVMGRSSVLCTLLVYFSAR